MAARSNNDFSSSYFLPKVGLASVIYGHAKHGENVIKIPNGNTESGAYFVALNELFKSKPARHRLDTKVNTLLFYTSGIYLVNVDLISHH